MFRSLRSPEDWPWVAVAPGWPGWCFSGLIPRYQDSHSAKLRIKHASRIPRWRSRPGDCSDMTIEPVYSPVDPQNTGNNIGVWTECQIKLATGLKGAVGKWTKRPNWELTTIFSISFLNDSTNLPTVWWNLEKRRQRCQAQTTNEQTEGFNKNLFNQVNKVLWVCRIAGPTLSQPAASPHPQSSWLIWMLLWRNLPYKNLWIRWTRVWLGLLWLK